MKSFAVVFTYSFDSDCAVYLFGTFEEAQKFLTESFQEELRIDTEENGWSSKGEISEDRTYARIVNHYGNEGNEPDITYYHLANVYK